MATSAGCGDGFSDDQRYAGVDEKKRKRMISNKESARRSRMRKQQVLLDLNEQIRVHQEVNKRLEDQIKQTWQDFMKVESENNVIRAQIKELTDRLQSLTDIVNGNRNNHSGEGAAAAGGSNSSQNNFAAFSDEDKAWVDSLLLLDDIDFDFLVPIDDGVNGGGAGGAGSSSGGSCSGGGGSSSGGSGGSGGGDGGGGDDMLVEPWKIVSHFQPPSPAFFEF